MILIKALIGLFQVIDSEGFRSNVGMIVVNNYGQALWARRYGQNSWQFPQGGVHPGENADEAMFRELEEEIGLTSKDVRIMGSTKGWLKYTLPKRMVRHEKKPVCIGQKQKWYLLRLTSSEDKVRFDACDHPEFDHWAWVSYWYPLRQVVAFKREVYRSALVELFPFVMEQQKRYRARQRNNRKRS
jgi:putative (di)nucleoside polyphosphate hydrolase